MTPRDLVIMVMDLNAVVLGMPLRLRRAQLVMGAQG